MADSIYGLDISKHTGLYIPAINPPLPINFVIQRITYTGLVTGNLFQDEQFHNNAPAVMTFPLRGAYHWVTSKKSWKEQADYFLERFTKYDYNTWTWDVEKNGNIYSTAFLDDVLSAIFYLHEQTKKPELFYVNPDMWTTWFVPVQGEILGLLGSKETKTALWIAHYQDVRSPTASPDYWTVNGGAANMPRDWNFWQWDDKAWGGQGQKFGMQSLGGDLNKYNGTKQDLLDWLANEETEPEEPPIIIPPEGEYMNTLTVSYISQIVPGALEHNNDCGAASSLMLLNTYNLAKDVTVDQLYNQMHPTGDSALSVGEMQTKMASYGLKNTWQVGTTFEETFGFLREKKPMIALINYGALVDAGLTERTTFRGAHFVTITGIDLENVFIHDPYRTDGKINIAIPFSVFDLAWKNCTLDGNPTYGAIIPLLPIQDLSKPVPAGGEYKLLLNGLNVRASANGASKLVGTIWASVQPTVFIDITTFSPLSNGYVQLTDRTGWVFMDYIQKL